MAKEQEKLSAAQRSKIRRLSQPKELAADEEGGELNIVPFLDIIMNVLMFVLATVAVTYTATLDTSMGHPSGTSARPPTAPTLGLSVWIVADGFSMKASGGNVAPGCNGTGTGIAIPRRGGDYDYTALNVCADKLKHASPDFAEETQVSLTASPDIRYQVVISTMDAVRRTERGDVLFPDVAFGLAR
jgi:biopolymer transport protein TolR